VHASRQREVHLGRLLEAVGDARGLDAAPRRQEALGALGVGGGRVQEAGVVREDAQQRGFQAAVLA
jgi:hypothetical protein